MSSSWIVSITIISLIIGVIAVSTSGRLHVPWHKKDERNVNISSSSNNNPHAASVPFFYIPPSTATDSSPPFLDLYKVLDKHKENIDMVVASIILSQEIARKSEWIIFPDNNDEYDVGRSYQSNANHDLLSSKLEERIKLTAEVLEADYFVLESILHPFDITLALPLASSGANGGTAWTTIQDNSQEKSSAYDSAMHIVTHMVRDWSMEGKRSRDSLYHWCITELIQHGTRDSPVLIPGSGLARLARDTSLVGFDVEANELSICMSAAAYRLLHGQVKGVVHPFAFDFLINEVKSTDRYQQIEFPDTRDDFIETLIEDEGLSSGSLSYTIGDFVEIYAQREFKGRYGSVITCFFIDTASNIYEYILVIRNALKSGGVWINVGPLQWHQNSKLNPSADELRTIIESMGFQIKSWAVDDEAINYRCDDWDEETRHTKYEGYRPLRFIATLPDQIRKSLQDEDAAERIMDIRRMFAPRKRASEAGFSNQPLNTISHVTITELS